MEAVDTLISGATMVTADGTQPGTLAVADGRIAAIIPDGAPLPRAGHTIDGRGLHLLPGVVDVHVHFREPGQEYKATYRSESMAAAVGGVTTICDMPNNGDRAVVNIERLEAKRLVAVATSLVDFGLYAFLCSDDKDVVRALVEAGIVAFKWDMSFAGVEVSPGVRLPTPEEALPYFVAAAEAGALVVVHAEDRPAVQRRVAELRAAGRLDARAHLDSRPAEVEVQALRQAIDLARRSGARLHVAHLSSAAGLEVVRAAKAAGLPVTAETIPAFLHLDAGDYDRLGTVMKIHPAVKEAHDRAALWEGLRDGSIDCIATDHAPHTREEKFRPVWEASPGVIGVQTSLPLALDAVNAGRLSLQRCVELLSSAPARIFRFAPRKGALRVGADADLVLVNMREEWILRNEAMLTPNRLTPFDGRQVRGRPVLTLLRGREIARDGVPVGAPRGRQVRPSRDLETA